jgi:hypothetical protein
MTNRDFNFNKVWASSGEAIDPDLDTTAPTFVEGKFSKGWAVEKEPHRWQNYLQQVTDLKLQIFGSETFPEYESDITYPKGSLFKVSGVVYIALADGATPESNSSPILSQKASDILSAVKSLQDLFNSHMAETNPHEDDIHDIGGYYKDEIDKFFSDATDPRTITYHISQRGGGVHSETPSQVGTLPKTGGAFTGSVMFNSIVFDFSSLQNSYLYPTEGSSIYLPSVVDNAVTKNNYASVRQNSSRTFHLPAPLKQINFSYKLDSDSMSDAEFLLTNIDDSNLNGWSVVDGVTLSGFSSNKNVTVVMYFKDSDGNDLLSVVDLVESYSDLKALVYDVNSSAQVVKTIYIYPTLNKYQKSKFKVP